MKKARSSKKRIRIHLITKIGAEPDMCKKLALARGRTFPSGEFLGINLGPMPEFTHSTKRGLYLPAKSFYCQPFFERLGRQIFVKAMLEHDWRFFHRIETLVRYPKQGESSLLYERIITFCIEQNCGTAKNPCLRNLLLHNLQSEGFYMTDKESKNFPRSLADVCAGLDIVLEDRRKHRSHRRR